MHVAMSLRPEATAPALARDRVGGIASEFSGKVAEDVRLLVTELVTNAVRHAGLRRDERIDLVARADSPRVEVLVRYPEHASFEPTLPLEPGEESRWGLFIVDRICDRWSVVQTHGVTEAWFEIDPSASAAA